MKQHIFRHIVRAPLKTFFGVVVVLFFTLTMGILQNTAKNIGARIDRLYDETIVYAEIRIEDFRRTRNIAGDIIAIETLQRVLDLGIVMDMYLMAGSTAYVVTDRQYEPPLAGPDILVGVNDLLVLTEDDPSFVGRCEYTGMDIQFANGDSGGFVYDGSTYIPIVLSGSTANNLNLLPGDRAYILHYHRQRFTSGQWQLAPAYILGIHDGEGLPGTLSGGAVVSMPAMEAMFGDVFGYSAFRFSIDPAFNRELDYITDYITRNLRVTYTHREPLTLDIRDQELRLSAAPLRQHMLLMQMLFPITIAVSVAIGMVFAMLFMLQNAKNAAIMRVLGEPMLKVRCTLWLGQMIVYLCGGLTGIVITAVIGLRSGLVMVAVPYLAGAVIGAAVGVVLITNRAPMELLQVRE